MRAVIYRQPFPIDASEGFEWVDLPDPVPAAHDILVRVEAVSVNPADAKIRANAAPKDGLRILGYDAAGVVEKVGDEVTRFAPGDRVWYAGAIDRPGSNATLQLVDERIVARMPATLDFADAAAMPLTTITAWEMLFDRLMVDRPVPGAAPAILVVGGAGGVGSMAIQLAAQLTDLKVIATASRPETREWVMKLGAHHVIDHSKPLPAQIEELGVGAPGFIISTQGTEKYLPAFVELVAAQGRIAAIDDPKALDVTPLKSKSLSFHWEFMFTRPRGTEDMGQQGQLLEKVASLADAGRVISTKTQSMGVISPDALTKAHAEIEKGSMIGKLVLERG